MSAFASAHPETEGFRSNDFSTLIGKTVDVIDRVNGSACPPQEGLPAAGGSAPVPFRRHLRNGPSSVARALEAVSHPFGLVLKTHMKDTLPRPALGRAAGFLYLLHLAVNYKNGILWQCSAVEDK